MSKNALVQGIQAIMAERKISLEEAIEEARKEIEQSRSYCPGYPQQLELLNAAVEYLKSLEQK